MYVSSWPLIMQVASLHPIIILIDSIISIAIIIHPLCMWLIVIVLSVTANTQETLGERLCEKGEAQSEKGGRGAAAWVEIPDPRQELGRLQGRPGT